MEPVAQSPTPARRAPAAQVAAPAKPPRRAKKMPEAAIEATAEAFLAGFKALPGAVQWRIVQKIEAYEDELDEAQLAANMETNPEDYNPENSITLEEYLQQRRALAQAPPVTEQHSLAA